jgi:deoxyribodipyrimidine photo-lyase
MKTVAFWMRRDLRLKDNTALYHALQYGLPVFIFDEKILQNLAADDPRVTFIHNRLAAINNALRKYNTALKVVKGHPLQVWKTLIAEYHVAHIFFNEDYEPYARQRDDQVTSLCKEFAIGCHCFKDQVVFAENEIVKPDGNPYTVFTAYKNRWLDNFSFHSVPVLQIPETPNFYTEKFPFPSLSHLRFRTSSLAVKEYNPRNIDRYEKERDYPAKESNSYLGPHLRFGTISIRQVLQQLQAQHTVFLSELIWREFFMQILYHFPFVVNLDFKQRFRTIKWRNREDEFEKWCGGKTGYPLVDAGMHQLNQTGYMHNRVRMICASFLCKHLLIHWSWGEKYFASKLLDYELSSNNGNWQWVAGTGCDAAPYFRIFNPTQQLKKFDAQLKYVKKWLPEYGTKAYSRPMVEHSFARLRAIEAYKAV